MKFSDLEYGPARWVVYCLNDNCDWAKKARSKWACEDAGDRHSYKPHHETKVSPHKDA